MFVPRKFIIPVFTVFCLLQSGCKTPVENVPNPNYQMGIYNLNTGQTALLTNTTILSFQSATFFFSDTDSAIYIVSSIKLMRAPQDLSNITDVFRLPDSLAGFIKGNVTLSPDKKYIAWVLGNGQETGLYLLNLNTLILKPIKTIPGTNIQHPSFSSDSRKVVYSTSAQIGGIATIETFDLFESSVDTILIDANLSRTGGLRLQFPHFSSNDTRIIYMTNSPGLPRDSLITVNLSGADKQLLDPECQSLGGVAVSRDGSRIVYVKDGSTTPLASIKSDGTGFYEITTRFGNSIDTGFSLSNNGEKITYWTESTRNIYILNGDGTNERVIAQGLNGAFSNNQNLLALTVITE